MNARSQSGNRIRPLVETAYRTERAKGSPAVAAYQAAKYGDQLSPILTDYPWLGELDDSPDSTATGQVEGFEVTVRVVPDDDAHLGDDDVTGWFTDKWEPGCIRNAHRDWGTDYKWYHPSNYDLTELPKDGSTKGMSKQVAAEYIAGRIKQAMYEDAHRDYWSVQVTVELEDRTMGSSSLWGIDSIPGYDVVPYLRDVAVECMAEALDQARTERKAELDRLGHWGEEADYPVADWQAEVAADDTRLGYRQWVENQRLLAES